MEAAINALEDGQVLLVENTRYEDVDGKKESKDDPELANTSGITWDGIFVNDAFGTAHRTHLTLVSQQTLKQLLVFLLENEIAYIKKQLKLQNVHS